MHKRFESARKKIGFSPMGYKEIERLKRKGYELIASKNEFDVINGVNMVAKARYDRELAKKINSDNLNEIPSYFEYFNKESGNLIKQFKST